MDEKDKELNEMRRNEAEHLRMIAGLEQSLQEDWHIWEEMPEDGDTVLALWQSDRSHLGGPFYALLTYNEGTGWDFNPETSFCGVVQGLYGDVWVMAWKELTDPKTLEAQLFGD